MSSSLDTKVHEIIGLTYFFRACGAGLTNLIIRSDKRVFDPADFSWTIVPVYATRYVYFLSPDVPTVVESVGGISDSGAKP